MKYLSEEQWFEKYYPKSWGNWRKSYNMLMYRTNYNQTACCWFDYQQKYEVDLSGVDNLRVKKIKNGNYKNTCIENFFLLTKNVDVCKSIQCYVQPKDNSMYINVQLLLNIHKNKLTQTSGISEVSELTKLENSAEYYIRISGNDDMSFTKYFMTLKEAQLEVQKIKENGLDNYQNDNDFHFTN